MAEQTGQTQKISGVSPVSGLSGSISHPLDRAGNRLAVTETLLTPVEVSVGTYLESDGQSANHCQGRWYLVYLSYAQP